MKRRDFLKVGSKAVPALLGAGAASGRLFGVPASLDLSEQESKGALIGTLAISRSGLPVDYWASSSRAARLMMHVREPHKAGASKVGTVRELLVAHGLDDSPETALDPNIELMKVILSPAFKDALEARDFASVLAAIREGGGGVTPQAMRSQEQLRMRMMADSNEIRQIAQHHLGRNKRATDDTLRRLLCDGQGIVTEEDLAIAASMISSRGPGLPGEALISLSVAAIFVTAAAYVVVVVAVGAWIWVSGPDDSVSSIAGKYAASNRLSALDPDLHRKFERAQKVASIMGDKQLADAAFEDLLETECATVVSVLREQALLESPAEDDRALVAMLKRYALRVAGVK